MTNNKFFNKKYIESLFIFIVLSLIIVNAVIKNDSLIALISAICGILYTFFAGKGRPECYLFGVTGSSFYCYLAWQNLLWGNLLLYACYYVPMQILGFFRWKKNLKFGRKDVVKISLSNKEMSVLVIFLFLLTIIVYNSLLYFKDSNPILDSITAVFSIGGMYLTVRRAIEQWIFWMIVNMLSLIMWINVLMSGSKVYSTIAMWFVYLILAVYFYIDWKKELNKN